MTLQEFLRKKKSLSEAHSHKPYWETKQRQWLSAIKDLYGDIQKWLQSSIKQGVVTVKTTPKIITEPYLGSYEVERLEIQVGEETVSIDPQGVELANILGEVIMYGKAGQAKLWLMPTRNTDENKNVWCVVSLFTNVNDIIDSLTNLRKGVKKTLPVLDRNRFAKILMSIMQPNIEDES
jgi:hypothetical protein